MDISDFELLMAVVDIHIVSHVRTSVNMYEGRTECMLGDGVWDHRILFSQHLHSCLTNVL